MDEIIINSLNEGNIHFFITINIEKEIFNKNEIKTKIIELEDKIESIEMLSWYNVTTEKNKRGSFHIHIIVAIKSLIGFNDLILNNIKIFLTNNYEKDVKIDVCWNFINLKKAWRYLYKDYEIKNQKKIKTSKATESKINIIKVGKEETEWFLKINSIKESEIKIKEIKKTGKRDYTFLKGVKIEEKNYNDRQLIFLWEYFLLINNIVIYNNKLFIKIETSMISYKEFSSIEFLYENISKIFLFFKKEFPFQFKNFDELNFISKFVRNKEDKIIRLKEFTSRKISFNFNILEFKDGIYSILHNKFVRTNKFEKNYNLNLTNLLTNKEISTIKFYNCSFENLKEPTIWLGSIEKVLGLKKRTNNLSDRIAKYFNEDDIEWLLIYIAYIFHYSTNELNKQNTLYIWGPSNTGKTTLIINLFINYFGKDNIGLISNNKNFEYQHILNKNLLIFDEFDIEKINIENFKKLVSKELILGEKKGKEPEIIKPTPVLISSNYNLENKLNVNQSKEAIINRLKVINFKERINKNDMDSNINDKIKEEEARIIIYCNRVYFKKIKEGKRSRMDDIKLINKI